MSTTRFSLDARIKEIIERPGMADGRWGMEFYSPATDQVLYSLNTDQLFVAASAVKVFYMGTAFWALGPDHRFETLVYRTGPVVDGVLEGDLVLVAGGDMHLSGRVQPDGTLAFSDPDHFYAVPVSALGPRGCRPPGDPLEALRQLAKQVTASIHRIAGRVIVDDSLFRQGTEGIAMGDAVATISPLMVNDNLIDVTITPGSNVGAETVLTVSPQTGYLEIRNHVTTIAAEDAAQGKPLNFVEDTAQPDGTRKVTLTGQVAVGSQEGFCTYIVPEPIRFGQVAFTQALQDAGVSASTDLGAEVDLEALASHYSTETLLAKHLSPPMSEVVKAMTKASSNYHTVMLPYLVGAIAGKDKENANATGKDFERRLLQQAGLDPAAPGRPGRYLPGFFTKFLTYMTHQPGFEHFLAALPVMGQDGTLKSMHAGSPAEGHVYAKTGTGFGRFPGAPSPKGYKALAGYIDLPDGETLVFSVFAELDPPDGVNGRQLGEQMGEAIGEIVTAVYEAASSES